MECQLHGITIHYETFGEGTPVVLLHGQPLDHTAMIFEMERYFDKRQGWRRIYPDLPGSGKTPGVEWIKTKDQILDVMSDFIDKTIPGERFVLGGTSYGSYLARGLVYRKAGLIDGLFLSITGTPATQSELPPKVTLVADQLILEKAKSESMGWFEEMAVVQDEANLDYARALQKTVADEKFLERTQGRFSFNVDKLPQSFQAPTLILQGRQDSGNGYLDAWNLLENYPRATFAVLDRAGHLLAGEQPELCFALVNEWLDRVAERVKTHPSN